MSELDELFDAAERGDARSVVAMLEANASLLHATNDVNETALHVACRRQRLEVVKHLLGAGARIETRGWLGFTTLHDATHEPSERSLPLSQLLLERGADASLRDDRGYTAFELAKENAEHDAELHALLATPDLRLESLRAHLAGHAGVEALSTALSGSGWTAPLRSFASGAPVSRELAIAHLRTRGSGVAKRLRIAGPGADFAATQAELGAIGRLGHTVHAVNQLRMAFGKKKPLELAPGPWTPDETCVRDTRALLEAFAASPLAEPLRQWLSQPRLSGPTTDWVHRYFAYADPSAHPTR